MNYEKVVFDTNVIVADYFNKQSASAQLMKLARDGRLHVFWSEDVMREMELILGNIRAKKEYREGLKDVFREENFVKEPPVVKIVADDPDDDKLLACAFGGGAEFLVSNDHHLLELEMVKGVRILRPKGFLEVLK